TPFPDSPIWHFSRSGAYLTSSGYVLAFRLKKPRKPWKAVIQIQSEPLWLSTWELPLQPKLKFFRWRMLHRIILTKDCLIEKNMEVNLSCPVCHFADEYLEHLLFECPISMAFYHMALLTPPPFINTHFVIYWRFILQNQRNLALVWILAWWRVWKGRNHVLFNHAQFSIDSLFRQFASHLCELPIFLPTLSSKPPSFLPSPCSTSTPLDSPKPATAEDKCRRCGPGSLWWLHRLGTSCADRHGTSCCRDSLSRYHRSFHS
ncbi:hypothetical protein LINPERPRIM_LOCUS5958, partial [Linum perenne]